jgi:hypothetical protein
MKNSIYLFILFATFLSVNYFYGQRPNIKKIQFKYIQPPKTPLSKNIKSYTSRAINQTSYSLPIPFPSQNKVIQLSGYETATSIGESDLTIKFVVNSISFDGFAREVKYKEKINDSVYIERTGGDYTVEAFLNYSEYIEDIKNNKNLMSNEGISNRNTFNSKRYKTYSEAIKAYEKNRGADAKRMHYSLYKSVLENFIYRLNDRFGFPLKQSQYPIARGAGRKYDYSDLENAFNLLKSTLKEYNGVDLTDEIKNSIHRCIEIWENSILEYIPKKRRTRIGDKIISELHYNIAFAYFVLRDWNKVYENLDKMKGKKRLRKTSNNFELKTKDMQNRYINQNTLK